MSTQPSSTVAKSFQVLSLFNKHAVLTSSLCEEELGIPRSTSHRLLISLRETGMVEQVEGGHFKLSLSLFELGVLAPDRRELIDRCGNALDDLADNTGCRVQVGVLRGLEVLYLDASHGRRARSQGLRTRLGYRGPLHATSLGKVLLAFGETGLLDEVLSRGLESYTPNTITDPAELENEVTEVRENGWAQGREELVTGVAALGVPVLTPQGSLYAAVSVVADPAWMSRQFRALLPEAQRTAELISRGTSGTYRGRLDGQHSLVVSR